MAEPADPADPAEPAEPAERLGRSRCVSASLTRLDDEQLWAALAAAHPLGISVGGSTSRLDVDGTDVFVKRVPLTDVERRHALSTADLHGLPMHFHYGVGSAGVGAWRELAAHRTTTDWVRDGSCRGFPLLHHWRVLDDEPTSPTREQELQDSVTFWHGSEPVRERLTALAGASAGLYLFLEHVSQTLAEWLTDTLDDGVEALDAVCEKVAEELLATAGFMASRGFAHFDAHVTNILTDGERLYVSDFGLALSTDFDLRAGERRFLHEHRDHDLGYVVRELVNWLVERLAAGPAASTDAAARNAFVRGCAQGAEPGGLPPRAAALVRRYAPVADVLNEFYFRLHRESRQLPFPARELRSACRVSGLTP